MKKTSILLTIFTSILLTACGKTPNENQPVNPNPDEGNDQEQVDYGNRIDEDLKKQTFLNDNYRNYYEIFVGSFYDSDGDGMGDLNGVTSKLDYIKDAGFNGIWLMPIFESPSYHKYDVKNYYKIDPDYGTMADFENLLKEAHNRDIKVIIDMVVNHASRDNPIFKESYEAYDKFLKGQQLNEREEVVKDYFTFSKSWDHSFQKFHHVPGKDFYYEGNFSDHMPEFNLESPNTKKYLENIYQYYINLGVDGFRLDAVKYFMVGDTAKCTAYLNEMSTYCKSLDPDFYIVGECWGPNGEIEKYYENSNCDSFFNFSISTSNIMNSPIFSCLDMNGLEKTRYLKGQIESLEMSHGHIPAPFLDNHDMNRYSKSNKKLTKFYYGLLAMYTGSTFAYYGDEIGTTGAIRKINNYNYDEDVRRHMNWSKTDLTGICKDPAKADNIEFKHPPLDEQLNDENSIFNYYKKANLLRNQNPTLTHGNVLETSHFEGKEPVARLDKEFIQDKLGIIINFDEKNHQIYDLSTTEYSSVVGQLVADTTYYIGDLGNKKISIPPLGIVLVK